MFRGYLQWNRKLNLWEEDEWLIGIYGEMQSARKVVEDWGEGRQWDSNLEIQITRYFGKRQNEFERGMEKMKGDPAVCEKVWLRYAEYDVKGAT